MSNSSQVWLKQHEALFTLLRAQDNEMYIARTQVQFHRSCGFHLVQQVGPKWVDKRSLAVVECARFAGCDRPEEGQSQDAGRATRATRPRCRLCRLPPTESSKGWRPEEAACVSPGGVPSISISLLFVKGLAIEIDTPP